MNQLLGMFLNVFPMLQMGDYASALSSQTSGIQSTVTTIISWVTAIMGLISLVQLILIFTSGGQGEDKVKKLERGCFY